MTKMRMETTCKDGASAKSSVRMADGMDLIIKSFNLNVKWNTNVEVDGNKIVTTITIEEGDIVEVAMSLSCMGFKEVSDIDISKKIIVS